MDIFKDFSSRRHAFLIAASQINPTKISPEYIFKTMKEAEQVLDVDADFIKDLYVKKARLGMFWAQTIASCMGTSLMKMTGRWEDVLWTMIKLVRHWQPENYRDSVLLYSDFLKSWILKMYSDQKLCPNPYLRLEMIRFIAMCPEKYLQEANCGMQVVEGFVATSLYMEVSHLNNESPTSIEYCFFKVFEDLNTHGYLHAVAAAAVQQVRHLKIGPESSFFNHIVQLLGRMSEALRSRRLSSSSDTLRTVSSFDSICYLYEMMVTTPSTMVAFVVPGLAEAAAASIVCITSSLVTMSSTLQNENASYLWLSTVLDRVYKALPTPVSRVLSLNHSQLLFSFNEKVAETGFCFSYFPTPIEESTEECPERFLDSVTQAVMEAPVLLHSSKMVVDESTLVTLLLTSHPSDPFTRSPLDHGSYSRLPDLQADIIAWKKSTIGVSCSESDVNSDSINDYEITRENDSTARNIDIDYIDSTDVDIDSCELRKLLLQFSNYV